jgi:hypothetical protein
MPEPKITRDQLKRLQTLWGQYARRELYRPVLIEPALFHKIDREQRLAWAAQQIGRNVSSFKDLTLAEASTLINILQGAMGIAETSPSVRPRRYRSRIKDKDQAHAAGTEGRRGNRHTLTVATAEDLAMIDAQLGEMGWTRARLDAFLQSPSSPLGEKRRSNPQLRTVGDINSVLWALRRIAAKTVKAESQA